MTTSQWDNSQIRTQFSSCSTLRDVITYLETDFSSRGEVICEIRVNGLPLSEADEERFANSPCESISELAVLSDTPSDLIGGALRSAATLLSGLERSAFSTAEMLRGNEQARAGQMLAELVEGCQWFVDTLVHVRGAAQGTGAPIGQAEQWLDAEREITQVVREVSDAYVKGDLVLVADLFEYELTAALDGWKRAIADELSRRR